MPENKIIVPDAMRRAFGRGTQDVDPEGYLAFHGLEQVILWLTDILHERNPDFHRAILEAEKKRCPGNNEYGSVMARRVDFEYGVSFARNYIRDLFREPDGVEDLMFEKASGIPCILHDSSVQVLESVNERIAEAYRRGQRSKESK